jgi:hypothetical protein
MAELPSASDLLSKVVLIPQEWRDRKGAVLSYRQEQEAVRCIHGLGVWQRAGLRGAAVGFPGAACWIDLRRQGDHVLMTEF